jgi:hypothetical protein
MTNTFTWLGPMGWIQRHIEQGTDPRHILQEMLPSNIVLVRK